MGRSFPFRHEGRTLAISVVPVEDAWELWIAESGQLLTLCGRVPADDAVEAWRHGEDRIRMRAEEVKSHILTGKMSIGSPPRGTRRDDMSVPDSFGARRA